MIPPLLAVAVVVPAHDERAVLSACLDGVTAAASVVDRAVTVVVVLDDCTDGTELVLTGQPVTTVAIGERCVGAARAAGVATALEQLGAIDPRRLWLAHTDADTVVGPTWLSEQVRLADAGTDLTLGTVRLAPDVPAPLVAAWRQGYVAADGHRHVHGASLGVRASTYLRAGGFAPVRYDEDVRLVEAVSADPRARVVRTSALPVVTSGRLVARAPHGFSGHLRGLDARAS